MHSEESAGDGLESGPLCQEKGKQDNRTQDGMTDANET